MDKLLQNKIFNVAGLTLLESIRNKIVVAFFGLAICCLFLSKALAWVSSGEDEKVMIDIGLSVVLFFGALTAAFTGANLVYQEEEKKTVFVLLTKPVSRWQFLLGKYLGLALVLLLNAVLVSAVFALYFVIIGGELNLSMLSAVYGIILEFFILGAIAILLSVLSSPILSAILTFVVALVGHAVESLLELIQFVDSPLLHNVLKALYYVLPNFNNFDFKIEAAHAIAVPHSLLLSGTIYAALYTGIVLLVAYGVLARRQY